MKTLWTSGLDERDAQEIELSFKASARLRKRLIEICEKEAKNAYQLSRDQYDSPNWQMLQADSIGYRRALEKIISIIS